MCFVQNDTGKERQGNEFKEKKREIMGKERKTGKENRKGKESKGKEIRERKGKEIE